MTTTQAQPITLPTRAELSAHLDSLHSDWHSFVLGYLSGDADPVVRRALAKAITAAESAAATEATSLRAGVSA